MFSWRQNSTALAVSGVDDLVEGDARLRAGLPDAAGRVAGAALAGPNLALTVYKGLEAAAQLVQAVGRDALADDEVAVVEEVLLVDVHGGGLLGANLISAGEVSGERGRGGAEEKNRWDGVGVVGGVGGCGGCRHLVVKVHSQTMPSSYGVLHVRVGRLAVADGGDAVRPGLGAADAAVVVVVVQVERGQVRGVDVPDGQVLEAHGTATFITRQMRKSARWPNCLPGQVRKGSHRLSRAPRSHPVRPGGGGWLRQV